MSRALPQKLAEEAVMDLAVIVLHPTHPRFFRDTSVLCTELRNVMSSSVEEQLSWNEKGLCNQAITAENLISGRVKVLRKG